MPSISDDGNVVAYDTAAKGRYLQTAVDDTNNVNDIIVRVVDVDDSTLVSTVNGAATTLTNGRSDAPSLSGDGQYVAYASAATNTGTADTDSELGVFLRRLSTAAVTLVSRATGPAGQTAADDSYAASVDQTGAHVAFVSRAANLGDGDADATSDIHVRDVAASTTTLVSRAPGAAGAKSAAGVDDPAISDDASTIAFTADGGSGLVAGLSPDQASVFARRATDTVLVSTAPGAPLRSPGGDNDLAGDGAISADGRLVAFLSGADGLSEEDDDRYVQAFVRDTVTRTTRLVSRAAGPLGAAAAARVTDAVLSADGRRVAFVTAAALDPADTNGKKDVYVRDLETDATILASVADGGGVGDGDANDPDLDADGSRVAFTSTSDNLGDGDTTVSSDVHVRDLAAGHTLLVSVKAGGGAAGASGAPSISADGTKVAFGSGATTLGDGDSDGAGDIHVRDLAAGTTVLASRADGVAGAKELGGVQDPSLSADGTRVAFWGWGTSLDPTVPDTDGSPDVYVRDLAASTTRLVDRHDGPGGAKADDAGYPVISGDGRSVLFETYDHSFAPGLTGEESAAIMVRDLATGRTRFAAAPDGADPFGPQYYGGKAALSADGGCVAFAAWGPGIIGGPQADTAQVYVHVLDGTCGAVVAAPPGGTTTTGGSPAPKDTTAPRITGAKLSHKTFRVAKAPTAVSAAARNRKAAPAGTKLKLSLSEAATLKVTIARRQPGWRKGKACVKTTRKLAHARRCTRAVKAGTLTRRLTAGAATIAFSGRIGRKALPAGRYTATLQATDAAGNTSKAVVLNFTVTS
jgi:Tol biopolymer transport system component